MVESSEIFCIHSYEIEWLVIEIFFQKTVVVARARSLVYKNEQSKNILLYSTFHNHHHRFIYPNQRKTFVSFEQIFIF